MIVRAAALWLLVTACAALPQQHVLQQPDAWPAPAAPSRELPWGELNVIATTDTHGWLMGHAHKSSAAYSGDWGDYASFVRSMKKQARERGVDLLLVVRPACFYQLLLPAHSSCRTLATESTVMAS